MIRPPRVAAYLLSVTTSRGDRRFALSDLAEEHETLTAVRGRSYADRWYWSQVRRSIIPNLRRKLLRKRELPSMAQRTGRPFESAWQDLRFALKAFSRTPGFTAVALTTIAVGIGVNTAAFSLVNSVVLNPLPFEDAGRLVEVWAEGEPSGAVVTTTPQPEMLDAWHESAQSFEAIGLFNEKEITYSGGDEPEILAGAVVSPNLMQVLRVGPRLGRNFLDADVEASDGEVVLLAEGFWQRRFGSDPGILGRSLTLDGTPHTVVGIVPLELERLFEARFFVGEAKQVWLPLSLASIETWEDTPFVIARLKDGVDATEAQAELDVIQSGLTDTGLNEDGWKPLVVTTREMVNSRVATVLWILLGAVGMVLLIGCSNIANMLMARSIAREHEFAVRSALGASRIRVTGQLLVEGLILSAIGAMLGVLLSIWTLDTVAGLAAQNMRELRSIRIDPIVLVFTLGLSVIAATIFALAPAAQLRLSGIADALRYGSRSGASCSRRALLRQGLIVAEVAMALVLFIGAALLLNSFAHLSRVDPGFDPSGVVALELTLPEARYPEEVHRSEFFAAVFDRVRLIPGIESVSLARGLPPDVPWLFGTVEIDGREDVEDTSPLKAGNWISPGYLETIGATLREGRGLTELDSRDESAPVIVNDALARKFWPNGGAVGARMRLDLPFQSAGVQEHTIVGVTRDMKPFGLADDADRMQIFFPFGGYSRMEGMVVVRASGDPDDLIPLMKEQVWAVDPALPITRVIQMEREISRNIARPRFNALLLSAFAVLALFLAVIGVYGVTSIATRQRTPEIGVRVALGADGGDILRLMVGTGMKSVTVGIAVGLGASIALTRFLRSLLFELEPNDPATYLTTTAVLVVVGIVACYLPSRRVLRVDPVEVLRQE